MPGSAFRAHLRAHRFTIANLSRLVGVRYATAHAWASGVTVPHPGAAERIEAATGYPASAWIPKASSTPAGRLSATAIGSLFVMRPAEVREDMARLGAVPFRRTYSPEDVARLNAIRPPGVEYLVSRMGPAARKERQQRAGKLFEQHLRELVLTRAECAAKVGVSVTSVGVWARGGSTPSPSRAETIERELGFPAASWA